MKNFIGVHKTEEEQEDQIKNWWKENGIQIIGGVVIGIAGIWGWDYYQNHIYAQSIEARDLYLEFSVNNNSSTLQNLSENFSDSSYQDEARLLLAKNQIKNFDESRNTLLSVSNSSNKYLANLAKIRLAKLYINNDNLSEAETILNNLNDESYKGLKFYMQAQISEKKNDLNSAKNLYEESLKNLSEESGLKNLIRLKVADLN
jgi:predicted negative regulator of RcsB-dependent stress response